MTRMSAPGYDPLSRPPRVGDPVKVVISGIIESIDDGHAVVVLDGVVQRPAGGASATVPVEQVWNQARPDQQIDGPTER